MFKINNYLVDCCFKKSYHSPVKDPHGLFTGAAIMFHVNLILTLNKYYEKLRKKEAFGHPAIVFGMLMYSLKFS